MDRFIVKKRSVLMFPNGNLKSNMDRFIEAEIGNQQGTIQVFKIQYG